MHENILITGATGFVGGAVVRHLVRRRDAGYADGSPVSFRDSNALGGSGSEPGGNRRNNILRVALRTRKATLPSGIERAVVGELSGSTDWRAALEDIQFVVHLAARVHIMRDSAVNPLIAYRRVNVDATLNLARQAAASGVKRFVFLSSVKVNGYATPAGHAFTEDDPPAQFENGLDPYGQSKFEAEHGLLAIALRTGLEVVVIRPPLVYGPGAKANFAALVRAVARGVPLPLGSVESRRSLIGLDNLADFVIVCMFHHAAANQVFLVSDGEDLAVPELIRSIGNALGRSPRLIHVPRWALVAGAAVTGKQDAMRRILNSLRVDSQKARTLLGWTPPVSVDEGMKRAVAPLSSNGPNMALS